MRTIQATHGAFAAILDNGLVVSWGDPESGGDSSLVQNQLSNVLHIQATSGAFAAILEHGSVVAWGNPFFLSDWSAVQDEDFIMTAHLSLDD